MKIVFGYMTAEARKERSEMKVYNEMHWPEIGLTITNDAKSILISQHGRTYRSRKWQLTDRLIWFVDVIVNQGILKSFQPYNHPRDTYYEGGGRFHIGIHHVSASRTPHEPWVADVGTRECPAIPRILFNRAYRDFVIQTGYDSPKYEHYGSNNIEVHPDHFEEVLSHLTDEIIDAVNSRKKEKVPYNVRKKAGITHEIVLEEAFHSYVDDARFPDPKIRYSIEGKYIDFLLINPSEVIIVELKARVSGHAQLNQLRTYLNLPSILANVNGRRLHGVLIAPHMKDTILPDRDENISFYTYQYREGILELNLVAGDDCFEEQDLAA